MPLEINVEKKEGGAITLHLTGSLDSNTYTDLETRVNAILASSPKAIIFNLEKLNYISSMGLRVIFATKKKIEANKGVLMITNLQPQVKKVFDIVAALPNLNVFASVQEADDYFTAMQKREIDKEKDRG